MVLSQVSCDIVGRGAHAQRKSPWGTPRRTTYGNVTVNGGGLRAGRPTNSIEKIANHGERVNVTDFVPVKGNKTFLGWSYTENSKTVDVKSGARIKLTKDATLYAVWG